MKKSIEFYTKILDFQVSKMYGEKIVSLVHNHIPIVLEEENTFDKGTNHVLLGIQSTNIKEDFERLKSQGVPILFDEPKPCPPGFFFIIEDPSGNQIEIVEFTNENRR
ncbi:VOC family protein [Evansella sp. AB-rgal1]|uniref:VOC family protein n=1 Tax=Evansella sp. AB-rgal1 TaxID=3242696 RepID=UPI00359D6214